MGLTSLIEQFIRDFLANPETNNLGPNHDDRAWDHFVLGFSRGDDKLYGFLKEHIGNFHWTPAEAFALGLGTGATDPDATDPATPPRPDELVVASWALGQTEATKAANRSQARFPSESWARSRIYGQHHHRTMQRALVAALAAHGYQAVAPVLLPECAENQSPTYGQASTWSERHAAYVSGLGTFGLCGGLITELGKAVRLGSVVIKAAIAPTPRPYSDPFAYCLYFQDGSCAECADRCPVGSVNEEGRDKRACARHLEPITADYVRREYGFDGYGCGLCQTGVPCESQIPAAVR
jgi:epoxyqueuosine reductase